VFSLMGTTAGANASDACDALTGIEANTACD
jgi:hypothetical protein